MKIRKIGLLLLCLSISATLLTSCKSTGELKGTTAKNESVNKISDEAVNKTDGKAAAGGGIDTVKVSNNYFADFDNKILNGIDVAKTCISLNDVNLVMLVTNNSAKDSKDSNMVKLNTEAYGTLPFVNYGVKPDIKNDKGDWAKLNKQGYYVTDVSLKKLDGKVVRGSGNTKNLSKKGKPEYIDLSYVYNVKLLLNMEGDLLGLVFEQVGM